jgi:glycosyltransferase involved in cell wall biosynthesis
MPKVSICIPTYKQVEHLRKTLSSIVEQEFTDYEVIISDDSPDDSVKNLLKEFTFTNPIIYVQHLPALGSPSNWNHAMQLAKGEYIKILHHDDYFTSPQSLRKFVELLDQNPNSTFAFSGTTVDLLALHTTKQHYCAAIQFKKMKQQPDQLFFTNYIGAPSATIIRNTSICFFDTQLKWLVDVDWYMQLLYANANVAYTQEPLICTVHGGEGQITQAVIADKNIQVKEHLYLFEKLQNKQVALKKYSIFFQLLFHKYSVENKKELNEIQPVSKKWETFFEDALRLKKNTIFLKKVVYWLKKKSVNDHLFTLRTYFK